MNNILLILGSVCIETPTIWETNPDSSRNGPPRVVRVLMIFPEIEISGRHSVETPWSSENFLFTERFEYLAR
jgi:hypothetical protein